MTVTFNTATPYVDIRALEYSGLDPVNPFDVGTSASGTGTSANSGTVTTTAANALIFGAGITTGGFSAAGTQLHHPHHHHPRRRHRPRPDRHHRRRLQRHRTAERLAAWVMQVATFKAAGAPSGDTTPPTAAITAPAPNATVSGTVTLTATATDNVGVAGVQFLVDNNPVGRRGHHLALQRRRGTPPRSPTAPTR